MMERYALAHGREIPGPIGIAHFWMVDDLFPQTILGTILCLLLGHLWIRVRVHPPEANPFFICVRKGCGKTLGGFP